MRKEEKNVMKLIRRQYILCILEIRYISGIFVLLIFPKIL
jgi:hypothetical protein